MMMVAFFMAADLGILKSVPMQMIYLHASLYLSLAYTNQI